MGTYYRVYGGARGANTWISSHVKTLGIGDKYADKLYLISLITGVTE
jgi:hypothetical protein